MRQASLVPYDREWPVRFDAWRLRLAGTLTTRATAIEHVGSTAIPGADAKPVLDLLIARRPGEDFEAWCALLAPLSLTHARLDSTGRGEGQWFFRDPPRTVHVHVYEVGSAGFERHVRFRDALRADARLRDDYVDLKRGLEGLPIDRYIEGKDRFVRDVEGRRPG